MRFLRSLLLGATALIGAAQMSSAFAGASDAKISGEIQSTASNALRAIGGQYGTMFRNDGADTYLLITNAGDQYGTWNGLRPFYFDDVTGLVTLGNGVNVVNGMSVDLATVKAPAYPKIVFNSIGNGADQALYQMFVTPAGDMVLSTLNDAQNVAQPAMTVHRSGVLVAGVDFGAAVSTFGLGLYPHVPTLAALKAAYTGGSQTITRDGYLAINDTAPVNYGYWTAACTTPDDGYQVPAAGGGCWIAQIAGKSANVGVWGVMPSNTGAGNTQQLGNAFIGLANLGPIELTAGPGIFTFVSGVTGFLPAGTETFTLAGAGNLATRFDFLDGGLAIKNATGSEQSVVIRDLLLTTHKQGAVPAIVLYNDVLVGAPPTMRIERVSCQGADGINKTFYWASCVAPRGSSNLTIDGMYVAGDANHQAGGVDLGGGAGDGKNVGTKYGIIFNIENSAFLGTSYGLNIESYIQGVTWTNNQVTNGTNGIVAAGQAGQLNLLAISGSQFNTTDTAVKLATEVVGFTSTNSTYFVNSGTCGISLLRNQYFGITLNRFEGFSFAGGNPTNTCGVEVGVNIDKNSVGVIDANVYGGITTGNILDATSANVRVGENNKYDFGVTTQTVDNGNNNTVAQLGKRYRTSYVQTLGSGATFSVPLPRTTTTATTSAAVASGSTTIPMTNTSNLFNNQVITGPEFAANTFVTGVSGNSISISPGIQSALTSGETLTFTNFMFSAPPTMCQLTNGAIEASPGYAAQSGAQTTRDHVGGVMQGGSAGTTARINLDCFGQ